MKKLNILISIVFSVYLNAQPPSNFYTTFGGDGVEFGYGVKETFNKQYIVIGSTTSYGYGSSDAYLALIDSMGTTTWYKTFGGLSQDNGKSIVINPNDSGFVFTGYTNSFGGGGFDIYVVRTDKNGNLKWQSSFGGLDWDFGEDLVLSSDGNIIVCGSTYSSMYGKKDGIILKIDINTGVLIWQKIVGGQEDDELKLIKRTSDGFYTLAGNSESYGDLNGDFWLYKINDSGDSIHSRNFGNFNKGEKCYDFIEDGSNKLVFCGSYDTSFYNVGKNISYIVRTDLNGNFVDEIKNGGAYTDDDKYLAITNNGIKDQYFLSRYVNHVGPFGIDVQPYLLSSNMVFLAATTYGSFSEDVAFDVIATTDNGYLMVGYTKGFGLISEDVFLIKLDTSFYTSENIVGFDENPIPLKRIHDLYYHDGILYFEEFKYKSVKYEILNSNGIISSSGITDKGFIEVNNDNPPDIYIMRLVDYGISTKFIKD